jgi:hypothetical protein
MAGAELTESLGSQVSAQPHIVDAFKGLVEALQRSRDVTLVAEHLTRGEQGGHSTRGVARGFERLERLIGQPEGAVGVLQVKSCPGPPNGQLRPFSDGRWQAVEQPTEGLPFPLLRELRSSPDGRFPRVRPGLQLEQEFDRLPDTSLAFEEGRGPQAQTLEE